MRRNIYVIVLLFLLGIAAGCGKKEPAATVEVVATYSQTLPSEPDDPVCLLCSDLQIDI